LEPFQKRPPPRLLERALVGVEEIRPGGRTAARVVEREAGAGTARADVRADLAGEVDGGQPVLEAGESLVERPQALDRLPQRLPPLTERLRCLGPVVGGDGCDREERER